jgi:hypothetical protein
MQDLHPMPSASEIYARRRAQSSNAAQRGGNTETGLGRKREVGQSISSLDTAVIYERRRQEAEQRGRASGYFD